MPILSLPATPRFQTAEFRLVTRTRSFPSSEDGTVQTLIKPGARWGLQAVLPLMARATAQPWLAILAELEGPAGRFYQGDPYALTPLGAVGASAPLVNAASQTGGTLITDGWDFSVTGIMLKGDFFSYDVPLGGRQLHQMIADANSDGSGNVTLSFKPNIRESPANNAAITISSPTCVMRLPDDNQALWSMDEGGLYSIALNAVESFNTG